MPPPPTELPANVVAIVARVPDRGGEGGGIVTKKEFHHALVQAAAGKGLKVVPEPGHNGYGKLKDTAMGELFDDSWIRGQAAEMGIGVRPRAVARELERLKRIAFASGAEYRRFLRKAHLTRRDVKENIEIQMLSARIQERVVAGIGSEAGKQKAFTKFVSEYEVQWKARTVCAPDYVIDRCSNAPAPSAAAG
jgi:ribosomal protein S24E